MIDLSGQPAAGPKAQASLPAIDQAPQHSGIWAGIFVLIILGATGALYFVNKSAKQQLVTLNTSYAQSLQSLATGDNQKTAQETDQLSKSLNVLKVSQKNNLLWSGLLTDLQTTTGSGLLLSNLSIDTTGTLKVEGHAVSYQAVASYLATLRDSKLLTRPTLVSALASTSASDTSIAFVLSAKVTTTQLKPNATGGGTQ